VNDEIVKWIASICLAICASVFWGAIISILIIHFLKFDVDSVKLFFHLPFSLIVGLYLTPKMRKIIH